MVQRMGDWMGCVCSLQWTDIIVHNVVYYVGIECGNLFDHSCKIISKQGNGSVDISTVPSFRMLKENENYIDSTMAAIKRKNKIGKIEKSKVY